MAWELRFMEWGNGWWTSQVLDTVLPWLTHLGSHLAVVLFVILSWFLTRQKKVLGCLVLLYGIQSLILYGLKFLLQRQRPHFVLEMGARFPNGPGEMLDPSFPSAHTLCAFMMATLLAAWFPKYHILFYILAGLVGWTRIYLGLHYPSDVIAGGLLGYGLTTLFIHWTDRLKDSSRTPTPPPPCPSP